MQLSVDVDQNQANNNKITNLINIVIAKVKTN